SGFIGMEVASVLAQKGIGVTMILRDDRIWKQFFTPQMSAFFDSYYTARHVRFVKQATVAELRGEDVVNAVALGDGRFVGWGMVVAGIGVQPVTDLLAGRGLQIDHGGEANDYQEP